MSKGIREAPTKAVMNELARESGDSPDHAYGLRQSLATAGMLAVDKVAPFNVPARAWPVVHSHRPLTRAGSTIASLSFALTGSNYQATFALAMVPPALALVWMVTNFRGELFGELDRDKGACTPRRRLHTTCTQHAADTKCAAAFGQPIPASSASGCFALEFGACSTPSKAGELV
eukprot:105604-Chlamydomonas_euryale.AAC.2